MFDKELPFWVIVIIALPSLIVFGFLVGVNTQIDDGSFWKMSFKDILGIIINGSIAFIAIKGLRTWREQFSSNSVIALLDSILEMQNALQIFRKTYTACQMCIELDKEEYGYKEWEIHAERYDSSLSNLWTSYGNLQKKIARLSLLIPHDNQLQLRNFESDIAMNLKISEAFYKKNRHCPPRVQDTTEVKMNKALIDFTEYLIETYKISYK